MSLQKAFSFIKFFIGWPVSLIALFFIARIVIQNKSIIQRFEHISVPLLFFAIVSFFLFFLCRAFLWHKIIEEKGHKTPFKDTAYLWESAEIKRFAPGFIWTLLSKTLAFSKNGLGKRTVAYSLAVEAEAFSVGCFIVSLLAIPLILNHLPLSPLVENLIVAAIATGAILSSAIFIFAKQLAEYTKRLNVPFLKKSLLKHAQNSLPTFSRVTNLYLLAVSCVSLLFFGLASYLAVLSITFITPALIINLAGFFVLSLLIGYLSFLVPMGLGIREGVIIYGLTAFMPLGLASASAIAARVTLIFSELVFLGFTFAWNKAKIKLILKVESFISTRKHEVLTGAAILVYIVYFTAVTFLRYDSFYTGRFDLGNMDQTVWNTIHGRIFESAGNTETISRLASHADFILILISPLYLIWEDPRMLLLLQTVVVSLGAVFIFKITHLILANKTAAAVFSILFLLNPALQLTNLYDFHAVTLATTLLLGTFYFFIKKKWIWFLVFAILSGLTKEQVWVVIALFGIYAIFAELFFSSKKNLANILRGAAIAFIPLIIFYYLVSYAIPNTRGEEHFALSYYSNFGDSPDSVIKNVILSPVEILRIVTVDERLNYLRQIFQPLGFLSLLSPIVLIFALPDLAINLLSNNGNLHQIYFQYTAVITPFIFIAAIFGVKNLTKWFPKLPLSFLLIFLVAATLFSAYQYGPLPAAKNPNIDMITKQLPNRKLIQQYIKTIPKELKVASTNNLGSHLSRRQSIFTIPEGMEDADLILFLLNDPFAQPSLKTQKEMAKSLKNNPNYSLLFESGDFVVFQKK